MIGDYTCRSIAAIFSKDLRTSGGSQHPPRMLGVNQDEGFKEAVRLYLMLHADHEGAVAPGWSA